MPIFVSVARSILSYLITDRQTDQIPKLCFSDSGRSETWSFNKFYCCRINKQELAFPEGIAMMGRKVPPTSDSTYLRPWPGDWLLGLRPQYSRYCSDCHSDDPDA
ncbi:hypothetical protein AVEN_150981-1 [Araneus ventricosus]|uniref:Uncharacterized protein n=1 Tax=Araneus ventricosus TaxID=182803 RepID=A0A4Y2JT01_ARAVE|nr:hypothetical protein AVEN_150981-1 [Araneus ventricosus]